MFKYLPLFFMIFSQSIYVVLTLIHLIVENLNTYYLALIRILAARLN